VGVDALIEQVEPVAFFALVQVALLEFDADGLLVFIEDFE